MSATLAAPTQAEPVVTLAADALAFLKRRAVREGREGQWLRLGVRGGGCSGLNYVIDFEADPDPEFDLTYEQDSFPIVVDVKSAKFLQGSTLVYNKKNLLDGMLVFENPNAVRSCGCGTSFTAK